MTARSEMSQISRRNFGSIGLILGAQARNLRATAIGSARPDETFSTGIASRKIPAVAAMAATENKILYAGAFGARDSSGVPVTTNSIFAIASMTKPVTSVAALQLAEEGKVKV